MYLIRVLPGAGDGAEVFGDVDEQGDKAEAEDERHLEGDRFRGETDRRSSKCDEAYCDQQPADIDNEVMREEVRIGEDSETAREPERGKAVEFEIKDPPSPRHVGTDRGIHETGEQRNTSDPQYGVFRVTPGADTIGGFEQLHRGCHEVKQQDDAELPPAFKFEDDQQRLNANGVEKEEIVTRDPDVRKPNAGKDDGEEQQSAKDARPSLFEAEIDELTQSAVPGEDVRQVGSEMGDFQSKLDGISSATYFKSKIKN